MTTDPRRAGAWRLASGALLTLISAGSLGLFTVYLMNDLSPSGIGPITAACSYLLGAIFLGLSLEFVRSGLWQIRNRRRDGLAAAMVARMVPWIAGLGLATPVFGLVLRV